MLGYEAVVGSAIPLVMTLVPGVRWVVGREVFEAIDLCLAAASPGVAFTAVQAVDVPALGELQAAQVVIKGAILHAELHHRVDAGEELVKAHVTGGTENCALGVRTAIGIGPTSVHEAAESAVGASGSRIGSTA